MNVFIVYGKKSLNAEPECLYIGSDGVKAQQIGADACESGEFAGGSLRKLVNAAGVPLPVIPMKRATNPVAAIAEAPTRKGKTTK